MCTLAGAVVGMNGFTFSSDGKRIARPTLDNMKIWDTETGNEVIELM